MQENPLSKYYRQPKIYIGLPSRGRFYPPDTLTGDHTNLRVYGMTAMDEILFKTPDALFTGEAVVEVIQSCIPEITDPWNIPQLDVDTILIAMRIATYGERMPLEYNCSECNERNSIDLDLPSTLDYYMNLEYDNVVKFDDLQIHLKPLTYRDQTDIALRTYQLQRTLFQVTKDATDEERNTALNNATKEINRIQFESFRRSIDYVQVDKQRVDNPEHITDWLSNAEKEYYNGVKAHILKLRNIWSLPAQQAACESCNHENTVDVGFDNANFFGNP